MATASIFHLFLSFHRRVRLNDYRVELHDIWPAKTNTKRHIEWREQKSANKQKKKYLHTDSSSGSAGTFCYDATANCRYNTV